MMALVFSPSAATVSICLQFPMSAEVSSFKGPMISLLFPGLLLTRLKALEVQYHAEGALLFRQLAQSEAL
jgi:hypothetical protein